MLIRMPDLLAQDDLTCLRSEAAKARSTAEEEVRHTERKSNSNPLIARCSNLSAKATALKEIHNRDALVTGASRAAGCSLAPTLSNYLYYRKGDFIGLHRDQRTCHSVLLVWLAGQGGGPLHIHPDLLDTDIRDLFSLARQWEGHPPQGQPHWLQDGPLFMTGSQYPHHRPPHDGEEEFTIAAFCFAKAQDFQEGESAQPPRNGDTQARSIAPPDNRL